ncbi:hypothetical protein B0H12DRAFT_1222395 [Mycena haematopus]|nr:hypothetical protein B0H12DRAFT_1222395 [Mycena haematopus]
MSSTCQAQGEGMEYKERRLVMCGMRGRRRRWTEAGGAVVALIGMMPGYSRVRPRQSTAWIRGRRERDRGEWKRAGGGHNARPEEWKIKTISWNEEPGSITEESDREGFFVERMRRDSSEYFGAAHQELDQFFSGFRKRTCW